MQIHRTRDTIQPLTYIQEVLEIDGILPAIPPIDILLTSWFLLPASYCLLLLADPRWEGVTISPNSTTPRSLSNDPSIRSKPDTSEGLPDGTSIDTSSPQLVRLDDSIPSIKEGRSARLQLHSIDNELESEGISMLGHEGGWLGRIEGVDVVVVWLRHVGGREESLGEPVLGNEVLRHCE